MYTPPHSSVRMHDGDGDAPSTHCPQSINPRTPCIAAGRGSTGRPASQSVDPTLQSNPAQPPLQAQQRMDAPTAAPPAVVAAADTIPVTPTPIAAEAPPEREGDGTFDVLFVGTGVSIGVPNLSHVLE